MAGLRHIPDTYKASTREDRLHAVAVSPEDLIAHVSPHVLEALRRGAAPETPIGKGVRATVYTSNSHRPEGRVLSLAHNVTIVCIGGQPVPSYLQQDDVTDDAPAVELVRHVGVWVAQPLVPAEGGYYVHSDAYLARTDDLLAPYVGSYALPLYDRIRPLSN